jgi:hypothetical protein
MAVVVIYAEITRVASARVVTADLFPGIHNFICDPVPLCHLVFRISPFSVVVTKVGNPFWLFATSPLPATFRADRSVASRI